VHNFLCLIIDKKEGEGEETGDNKTEEGKKDEKNKKTDKKKEEKKAKKEPKKPKIETLKEPLEFEVSISDLVNMTANRKAASKEKLEALTAHDRAKKARYISRFFLLYLSYRIKINIGHP
jgi:hypothetical protein